MLIVVNMVLSFFLVLLWYNVNVFLVLLGKLSYIVINKKNKIGERGVLGVFSILLLEIIYIKDLFFLEKKWGVKNFLLNFVCCFLVK